MSSFSSASSSILSRLARRGAVRPVGAVVVAALIAAVGLVAVAPSQVAQAAPPVKAAKVTSAPDLLSARISARAQGSRVEVESERAATSTTWVNPDGTLTTDEYGGPIRFRDASGGWQDVDLTLAERADGTVAPKGHPGGLVLAGASKSAVGTTGTTSETDAVATNEAKGGTRQVSLAWSGKLGRPALSGTTATYANVQPGVDLVVQALRTGYEQSFVIRDAAALSGLQATAGAGGAVSWSMPVKTKGLTARAEADGSVSFVDAKGAVGSVLHAPAAWDSQVDPRSREHLATGPVRLSVAQKSSGRALVTITPDQAWLADPARVFPITIDPTYTSATLSPNFDTWVQTGYVADLSASTSLKVGSFDGSHHTRAFLNFPLATIRGKQVKSAYLSLAENGSNSCAARAMNVYYAALATTSTRWTSQPTMLPTIYGTLSTAKGFSSACPTARISIPITSLAQAMSISAAGSYGVGLEAADESDIYGWKNFGSLESNSPPFISYTYNRRPNVASTPTIANVGTYNAMDYPWKTQPVMSSAATDPDGNSVRETIEVHTSTTTSSSTLKSSCLTLYVASGATGSCAAAVLPDNTTLYARSAVVDDQGLWNGTWSPWKTFRTAQSPPPAPGISCPGYTDASWADVAPTTNVTCTITSTGAGSNTAITLTPTVDGVAQTAKATSQLAYTFTLSVSKTAGAHSVKIVARSASTLTTTAQIGFGYGNSALTTPAADPRVTTTGAVKIAASGPPRGSSAVPTATVRWRVAGSGTNELVGWNDATTGPLTVTDNGAAGITADGSWNAAAETQDGALDSDANTAGMQPTVLNPRVPVLLDVQVCLTYTSGTQCTWSSNKTSVLRVPHAFGNGFPTAPAGPGQVALFTGEFNTSATDVTVPGYTGTLSISRSHSTFGNSTAAATDPTTSVFGPGWTAQLDGSDAGHAGLQVADGTALDGTIAFIDAEGSALVYSTPTGARRASAALLAGTYPSADEDTTASGTTLAVSLVGTVTTLTLTDEDGTATTFTAVAEPTDASTMVDFAAFAVTEPGNVGKTTYARDTTGRITRILAPVPPGVTCPAYPAALNPGCRALRIAYATTTTATTTTPGDIDGQVSEAWLDIYDPAKAGGPGMASVQVAAYKYDASKRLVQVADPRSTVAPITYGYDAGNHLTQVASAGQTPIALTYTGSDPKLSTVTRARPAGDPAGGTATLAAFVYDVPTSGAGLPDLSGTAVATWAQAKAPTYAAAVFGPDYTGSLTSPDYSYADLSYTDAAGYTVNTASYGAGAWQRTSTDYDTQGNETRTLDAKAIAAVISGGTPGSADQVATSTVYNPVDITAADGTVLTPAGSLVTDTYGPARSVSLSEGTVVNARPRTHTDYDQGAPAAANPATGVGYHLPTTVTTLAADPGTGTDLQTISRTLTGYTPIDGKPDTDPTSGWVLGAATTTTMDMDLSGAISAGDITTRTRFDTEGRAVESRQPSSTGTDAGTTLSAYFSDAPQTGANATCGGKPAWAGQACRTYPAANPTAGAAGAGTLPDSTTTALTYLLAPTIVVETSGAVTRTSTSTYLDDGRADTTRSVVAGLASSTPQAGTKSLYDPATGQVTRTVKLDIATGAPTTTGTTIVYDDWGRQISFTSETADTSTTGYDAAGRVSTVTDSKGTVVDTYDGTDAAGRTERRGQVTKQVVTRTGTNPATSPVLTYTGAYDAGGALIHQGMPGGISQDTQLDVAGEPVAMSYSGQVTPVTETIDPVTGEATYTPGTPTTDTWLAWSQTNDINGRVAHEWTPAGAAFTDGPSANKIADVKAYDAGDALGYDRAYTYDRAQRLTKVTDRTATVTGVTFDPANPAATTGAACAVRTYAFTGTAGANGSRTAQTSTNYPGADCLTTPGPTKTRGYAYDSADRPTTGAAIDGGPAGAPYVYDELGRQSTLPAVDAPDPAKGNITLAYYDSDLPQAITQAGITTGYTLNVDGRRQTSTTGPTGGAPTSTTVRHYTDTSDNPAWIDKDGATTRSTGSMSGGLGVTITDDGTATLPLANLHGDVVTNITLPAAQDEATPCATIGPWSDYTEFGTPRDAAATAAVGGPAGYGWLGAKERSTSVESAGLTLMGDRLYNAATGRFTSPDPEPGGNPTAYTYPTDPINMFDLDGHWSRPKWLNWKNAGRAAGVAAFGACVFLSAGVCAVAGVAAAAVSARSSAGRWGGRKFYKSWAIGSAFAVGGAGAGKALGAVYKWGGLARVSSRSWRISARYTIRNMQRSYSVKASYRYHWTYYKAQAGLGVSGIGGNNYSQRRWG